MFIFLRYHKNFAVTDFVFSNIKKMDTGFRSSYNTTNTFIHFRYKVTGNWFAVTVFQIVCICITCFFYCQPLWLRMRNYGVSVIGKWEGYGRKWLWFTFAWRK